MNMEQDAAKNWLEILALTSDEQANVSGAIQIGRMAAGVYYGAFHESKDHGVASIVLATWFAQVLQQSQDQDGSE